MPFAARTRDGVLILTLDTPGAAINIFNHATAEQLIEILAAVTSANTRAVVFETAKPNSFINGVGLLLAHAAQTHADIVRASSLPWAAYRAVHDAGVPTIAVVRGNCFGCGVEFALNCDYRIASDSAETQFYMTELNDYLFIPLFGSTWNLPEAVGLQDATDLLLWGDRWDADTAYRHGLVDAVVADGEIEECSAALVDRVLAGDLPSRKRGKVGWGDEHEKILAAARRRIAALPPAYHAVYGDALELLASGARQESSYVEHQQRELDRSAASALAAIGKSAYAFFYLRQMASERASGRFLGGEAPVTLSINGDRELQPLAAQLRRRQVPGVTITDQDDGAFRLISAAASPTPVNASADRCREVRVRLSYSCAPIEGIEIYAPLFQGGARLLELAIDAADNATTPGELAPMTRALQRYGFEIACTRPGPRFVSNRLLLAYLAPLLRFVERAGDPGAIDATLRELGFVRRTSQILSAIEPAELARDLAASRNRTSDEISAGLASLAQPAGRDGPGDADLADALCLSLLDAALAIRAEKEARDPSIIDLIARELLDFPRHLCSLCTWLKKDRVRRALERGDRLRPLLTESVLSSAHQFVAGGREFYR